MRHFWVLVFFLSLSYAVKGQVRPDTLAGQVTFTTSQNIYVKFNSTKAIHPGDTLYRKENGNMVAALIVKNVSSTSSVCSAIDSASFSKGTEIFAFSRVIIPETPVTKEDKEIPPPVDLPVLVPADDEIAKEETSRKKPAEKKSGVKGRITAASYVNFSPFHETDRQRMRYSMSLNTGKIGNTGLSFETYMNFRHTLQEWDEVRTDFNRAFKIYSFAFQYETNNGIKANVGRKINPLIANLGAIDGLQLEKKWKKTTLGIFGGSRPDHTDYSFNFDLKEYGAYAGYNVESKNGLVQNTVAFAEQRNGANIDRRYAYFQHFNSAIKHLNIFTSFEFDLYTMQNLQPKNTFTVSSIYLSIRYRVSDKLSLFASYDARNNIIYYETYKNFIDQLLEDETRQGLRFSFTFRPIKRIMFGSSAGYRFQKGNPVPSKNVNSYLTISSIAKSGITATITNTWIQTGFVESFVYGLRLNRDFMKGKLYGEIEVRKVDYQYTSTETTLKQTLAGCQLSWRVNKKFSVGLNYEGEFQQGILSNRIYTHLTQRF